MAVVQLGKQVNQFELKILITGGVYNGQSDEFVQKLTELIPIKRMASKDEYRGAVQFLCSDASAYMNGQNIVMDGGRSIL
jgi:NAD(P)-dependent dehydrogenase (short-subunit alcohol dehydrogenase family)